VTYRPEPADIVMVKGFGFVARGVRCFQRGPFERWAPFNHCATVVDETGGIVEDNPGGVERTNIWERYGNAECVVAIYRPLISLALKLAVAVAACQHIGEKYGWGNLVCHFIDNQILFGFSILRRIRFRRLVCSGLTATLCAIYDWLLRKAPHACEPDDLGRHLKAHPELYECVHSLGPLGREEA
jgi:hypothetical protein